MRSILPALPLTSTTNGRLRSPLSLPELASLDISPDYPISGTLQKLKLAPMVLHATSEGVASSDSGAPLRDRHTFSLTMCPQNCPPYGPVSTYLPHVPPDVPSRSPVAVVSTIDFFPVATISRRSMAAQGTHQLHNAVIHRIQDTNPT